MGSRRFGEEIPTIFSEDEENETNEQDLMKWIENDEIGRDSEVNGPFGRRKIIYCDYTASGRAINSIEEYLKNEVLPYYGNTHSSVTVTAEQTTLFMHEARQEVRAMTGAGDLDDVIFTGSGATCAVELLGHLIDIENQSRHHNLMVVHTEQEHHTNLLIWRKWAKKCWKIDENSDGRVSIDDLEKKLKMIRKEEKDSRIIGAFTACSNITGILTNVDKVTEILKKYNAISIWDFASAAPYVPINMNGKYPIDALFFSGHKFPGGVSSPGVLIIKKSIIEAKQPKRIGGGTIFFVNNTNEWYLKEAEHREEGGTADAIGAIRLAMAIKLKRTVGETTIASVEHRLVKIVLEKLANNKNIELLGATCRRRRLAIFSFLIRHEKTRFFYHHNFIAALLNDLFGIQTRAGCMCAGPYAHKLLNIDEELSAKYLEAIQEPGNLDRTHLRRHAEYSQHEFLRPGFTRISFPYFFDAKKVEKIVECLEFVADNAHRFLHLYQINCESGEWHHKNQRVFHGRRWLGHVKFTKNGILNRKREEEKAEEAKIDKNRCERLSEALRMAQKIGEMAEAEIDVNRIPDGRNAIDEKYQKLRWFLLPIEIAEIQAGREVKLHECPINPRKYQETIDDEKEESEEKHEKEEKPIEEDEEEEEENLEKEKNNEEMSCPLNSNEQIARRGIDGEIGDKKEEEEVRETEDWNKRVIVRKREMTKMEEMKLEWHQPSMDIYKKVTDVIHQLKMIRDGDKVLVCLSGGKDSLSLLHILRFYQQRCIKARSTSFELGAITIDPGSAEYNPRPLIEYCQSLNIDYFYEEQDIIGAAKRVAGLRSICAFCSRMKRGRLAAAAQLHGWNVLAMGQHLDDLAESFFIAAFQNGNLSTMKAQYATKDGALRVIRPLVFVREKALRNFAEEKKLPVVAENCPACFNQATERHRIKQLLAQQELIFPDLFNSLRSALKPLLLVDSAHTNEMRTQAIENIVRNGEK